MPGSREASGKTGTIFQPYTHKYAGACLNIFNENCPTYFAPNERADFEVFLAGPPADYEVCLLGGAPVGAFGLTAQHYIGTLNWILISPSVHGAGVGTAIMRRVLKHARERQLTRVRIAASHKSQGFFSKFGAKALTTKVDGWGPGMHRVDMEILMSPVSP